MNFSCHKFYRNKHILQAETRTNSISRLGINRNFRIQFWWWSYSKTSHDFSCVIKRNCI